MSPTLFTAVRLHSCFSIVSTCISQSGYDTAWADRRSAVSCAAPTGMMWNGNISTPGWLSIDERMDFRKWPWPHSGEHLTRARLVFPHSSSLAPALTTDCGFLSLWEVNIVHWAGLRSLQGDIHLAHCCEFGDGTVTKTVGVVTSSWRGWRGEESTGVTDVDCININSITEIWMFSVPVNNTGGSCLDLRLKVWAELFIFQTQSTKLHFNWSGAEGRNLTINKYWSAWISRARFYKYTKKTLFLNKAIQSWCFCICKKLA